jgi:hypothetical protein
VNNLNSKVVIWSVLVFIAGAIFGPLLGQATTYQVKKLGWFSDEVYIDACLPLKSAHLIIRNQVEEPILSQPIGWMNETSVLIRNDLSTSVENARIIIFPIGKMNEPPRLLQSNVASSSISHSANYLVQHVDGALVIDAPVLNRGDSILVYSNYDQPIAYLIEISSDEYNGKFAVEPGCDEGVYSIVSPFQVFQYFSEYCEGDGVSQGLQASEQASFSCNVPYPGMEFEVTDEMRGEHLKIEHYFDREPRSRSILQRVLGLFTSRVSRI